MPKWGSSLNCPYSHTFRTQHCKSIKSNTIQNNTPEVLILIVLNCQTVSWAPGHPNYTVMQKLMTKNDYYLLKDDDIIFCDSHFFWSLKTHKFRLSLWVLITQFLGSERPLYRLRKAVKYMSKSADYNIRLQK